MGVGCLLSSEEFEEIIAVILSVYHSEDGHVCAPISPPTYETPRVGRWPPLGTCVPVLTLWAAMPDHTSKPTGRKTRGSSEFPGHRMKRPPASFSLAEGLIGWGWQFLMCVRLTVATPCKGRAWITDVLPRHWAMPIQVIPLSPPCT